MESGVRRELLPLNKYNMMASKKKKRSEPLSEQKPKPPEDNSVGNSLSAEATVEGLEGVPASEQVKLQKMLLQALTRFKKESDDTHKQQVQEMSHLSVIAQEYLSSFLVLGYDMNDEKVSILYAPSAKDEAAVVDLLRSTFMDIASNRP